MAQTDVSPALIGLFDGMNSVKKNRFGKPDTEVRGLAWLVMVVWPTRPHLLLFHLLFLLTPHHFFLLYVFAVTATSLGEDAGGAGGRAHGRRHRPGDN